MVDLALLENRSVLERALDRLFWWFTDLKIDFITYTLSKGILFWLCLWLMILVIDKPHFSGNGKITDTEQNNIFLHRLFSKLKQNLLWCRNISLLNWGHMHNRPDIQLLNPFGYLTDPEDRSIFNEIMVIFPKVKFLSQVFFIVFRIFLSVI